MLDQCPQCDYSLAGLPANHACPECGLRYDEKSEVYRGSGRWAMWLWFASMTVGLLSTVLLVTTVGRGNAWRGIVAFGMVGLYMVAIPMGYSRVRRYSRTGLLVAVLPDGLYTQYRAPAPPKLIPWTQLEPPVEIIWYRTMQVRRRGRLLALSIHGVFQSKADLTRLKAQIEQRIAHAATSGADAPDVDEQ